VRNITDQKKAEIALQEKLRELDEKNQELTLYIDSNFQLEHFAYIASHDLREPIRTVHSFAQLLKKKYEHRLDEDGVKSLNFIITGAMNMNQLIEDLLTYSRVNSEAHVVQTIIIKDLITEVTDSISHFIKEKNATIDLEEVPLVIQANKLKIKQLFQNLITNAIKFHHLEKMPHVHISGIEQDEYWLFEIKDNGIGVPDTMKDKIFQLFKKIHYQPEHYGTGIGLALCKRIIDQHRGEIWVESQPGLGSSFYFTIKKP
jgi:light-regulated signal transduction histidine kinase (bacteriophytochrome)